MGTANARESDLHWEFSAFYYAHTPQGGVKAAYSPQVPKEDSAGAPGTGQSTRSYRREAVAACNQSLDTRAACQG